MPVRTGAINDLWDGQAQALSQWNERRTRGDNLILLNTGAGKTIVGLLIAESLRRETRGNVLYLCANNDLVGQVAKEADRLGLDHTNRVGGRFSNDSFERGRAICITNYQALLNAQTTFRGEKVANALVLDDAHVAEGIIRDQFTLRINKADHSELYRNLVQALIEDELDASWKAKLSQVVAGASSFQTLIASPLFGLRAHERLNALFMPHLKSTDRSIELTLAHLFGKWRLCTFVVSASAIEISPPALPTLSYREFSDTRVKRVYLSATLEQTVDFARAFGRQIADPIRPDVDAGNGERLVLFSSQLALDDEEQLVERVSRTNNTLLAVPNYHQADRWKNLATPSEGNKFSASLDMFRNSSSGVFIIVGRYDGIDLPNDTCRVMALDGVPRGTNLLEKFCWEYLDLQGELRSRIATRITQLFGRIIRGRVDHGVFLILSKELNNWLGVERNVALLPELLRNQLMLGGHVHESLKVRDVETAAALIGSVISRAEGWVQFYARWASSFSLDDEVVAKSVEQQQVIGEMAAHWVELWSLHWTSAMIGDIDDKRRELESLVPKLAAADTRAAGWLNIWIAASYAVDGQDANASDHFGRARTRLRLELPLPRVPIEIQGGLKDSDVSPMGRHFLELFNGGTIAANNRVLKEDRDLAPLTGEGASSNAFEEALRCLGECFGFQGSRPDNEAGKGPDVLWLSRVDDAALGLEAKSDKTADAYNKGDIGQAHQHLVWLGEAHASRRILGLCLLGQPKGVTEGASPTSQMCAVDLQALAALVATYRDLRNSVRADLGASRLAQVAKLGVGDEWTLEAVLSRLMPKPLA